MTKLRPEVVKKIERDAHIELGNHGYAYYRGAKDWAEQAEKLAEALHEQHVLWKHEDNRCSAYCRFGCNKLKAYQNWIRR